MTESHGEPPLSCIRVLLADDETLMRAGVRAILGAAPDIEVVAEAADGRETIDQALRHRPDVCLLDIRMPRLDGLGAAAELARALPGTAVVMLTTFSEDEYIAGALASGAAGFLLKSGDPRELIAGVRPSPRAAPVSRRPSPGASSRTWEPASWAAGWPPAPGSPS